MYDKFYVVLEDYIREINENIRDNSVVIKPDTELYDQDRPKNIKYYLPGLFKYFLFNQSNDKEASEQKGEEIIIKYRDLIANKLMGEEEKNSYIESMNNYLQNEFNNAEGEYETKNEGGRKSRKNAVKSKEKRVEKHENLAKKRSKNKKKHAEKERR